MLPVVCTSGFWINIMPFVLYSLQVLHTSNLINTTMIGHVLFNFCLDFLLCFGTDVFFFVHVKQDSFYTVALSLLTKHVSIFSHERKVLPISPTWRVLRDFSFSSQVSVALNASGACNLRHTSDSTQQTHNMHVEPWKLVYSSWFVRFSGLYVLETKPTK